ncbi:MAG: P1 family peptidase [Acidobacteria bacterium]|nr:P1 family peptidase [Acidobacteriota bacterium]
MTSAHRLTIAGALLLAFTTAAEAQKPRARDIGIPFEGSPGPNNAITDVAGVEVGMTTLISGEGPLVVGKGPVRTGVTAILPRGKASKDPVFASWFSINGNGEMTGTTWIDEGGFLEGPVFITNTHSVGTVRDAAIKWAVRHGMMQQSWALPVVAETYDGGLNDINGFHVHDEHVFAALDGAAPGPVAEGNVGGGTAMNCYGYKCGTGTASRRLSAQNGGYTVGVLVQANHGGNLRVAGVPVYLEMSNQPAPGAAPAPPGAEHAEEGSIIIVIATDAPLMPHQLKRLAHRASHGLGRTGATSGNGSGDIAIAFSTANPGAAAAPETAPVTLVSNRRISSLFTATAEAVEEAIINALIAGETITGANGRTSRAIDHEKLREVLRKHDRLVESGR